MYSVQCRSNENVRLKVRVRVRLWVRIRVRVRVRVRLRKVYLPTTHSIHFIYCYMASDMVKDHSDSKRGKSLLSHGQLLPISRKGSFI